RLAGEAKIHLRAINLKVATAQRRQPEAVVLLRIGVVADSHQGFVEKPDNRRDDTRAGYAAPSQVLIDDGAQLRQRLGERYQAGEFGVTATLKPVWMVAVLLPSLLVAPRRLDVAVGVGCDPHVGPGWRYGKRAEAVERRPIIHPPATGPPIAEAASRF